MRLDDLGEFPLIERLTAGLESRTDVALGVGDDAAALDLGHDLGADHLLLATCDAQVEGTHFLTSVATPEEIGHKVAAALVGTFLGILLCYGLLGPIAGNMAKMADEEHAYYYVLRVSMLAFIKGVAPILAVEIGRRAVPGHVRPKFQELESSCRSKGAAAGATAAA